MISTRILDSSAAVTAALVLVLQTPLVVHADDAPPRPPTGIELSVEAQMSVDNDWVQATVFAEVVHVHAGESARQVAVRVGDAIGRIKAVPGILVRTQSSRTLPVYGKGGREIEAWRSRTELMLETDQVEPLAKLLSQLQNTLAVGNLILLPRPSTLQQAEDRAIDDALRLLQARADRVAKQLGKPYRLAEISIGSSNAPPTRPIANRMLAAEAVALPIETGESTITVPIRARIELLD